MVNKKNNLNSYLEFLFEQDQIKEKENLNEVVATATAGILGTISPWLSGIMSATLILRYGSGLLSDYLTKAGRQCNHLNGASKNLCIIDFKIRGFEAERSALRSKQNLCGKSRDPLVCREKIKNKLETINNQLKDLYEHKDIFREKARKEKQAQMGVV